MIVFCRTTLHYRLGNSGLSSYRTLKPLQNYMKVLLINKLCNSRSPAALKSSLGNYLTILVHVYIH